MVSYNFWEISPIPPSAICITSSPCLNVPTGEITAAVPEPQTSSKLPSFAAATNSPVGTLRHGNDVMQIADGGIGEISQKLYDTITGIQLGKIEAPEGWVVEVK